MHEKASAFPENSKQPTFWPLRSPVSQLYRGQKSDLYVSQLLSSFIIFLHFPASPSLSSSRFLAFELSCQAPFISLQKFPFLHFFVKTMCYLCYSVAPVSNSFPSTGGISSKIFSWRFITVSNPLANCQFLNHQGLKVV